jgi:hypothetical protein
VANVTPDGKFEKEVALREGANPLEVTAESIDGKTKAATAAVTAATHGPPVDADPSHMFTPKSKDAGP